MASRSDSATESARTGRVLVDWHPEEPGFWERTGRDVASRNLWLSIPCLLLAFAVWMIWSVVVVNMPSLGFTYTTEQLFLLVALPGLSGAALRMFYAFLVPIFGGRRWTAMSTASLLLPAFGIGLAVQDPATPYWVMAVLALLCGLGGGNFASSMANINYFFPSREKGTALGLNAGLGNLGVSVVQFVVPLVITGSLFGALGGESQTYVRDGVSRQVWLQNAGFVWVPFIAAAAVAAWFGMNDIAATRAPLREQVVIFTRKHNWLLCWLYIGSFGSFIGLAAGVPLLIHHQFPAVDATEFAFLGPLTGALLRPVGGWIADRLGGARVALLSFLAMIAAVYGVLCFLPSGSNAGDFFGFLVMFMLLFALAGLGNGAIFRMIPTIFVDRHRAAARGKGAQAEAEALLSAAKESGAVLGFTSAVGAVGGFVIPWSFGSSIVVTGGVETALCVFIGFYASCAAVTWWYYARKGAEAPC